jgi:hypothetical protein
VFPTLKDKSIKESKKLKAKKITPPPYKPLKDKGKTRERLKEDKRRVNEEQTVS